MIYQNTPSCCHNTDKNDIVIAVMDYIDSNWSDAELNLNKISAVLGYVPSYISEIFRQHMHTGIIEYINKKRIDNVKLLLKTTDLNLSQIASKTGFYSEASLIRVFKKYEQITPGNYRKNIR